MPRAPEAATPTCLRSPRAASLATDMRPEHMAAGNSSRVGEAAGQFRCEPRSVDGDAVLVVIGAIDVTTAPALEEALFGALDEAPATLTVDLRRVNHLDSTGVRVIVRALRRARNEGVSLRICTGPRSRIVRVLELSGLTGALPVVEQC